MSASTARHETRALLRAHLAAASGYGHLTRHCPVCHRLLRLAMEQGESGTALEPPSVDPADPEPAEGSYGPRERAGRPAVPVAAEGTAVPTEGDEGRDRDERPSGR
ncbi:DUF6274 family protein [Streptomyces sp. OUCMDZ-4982]|uniref:DUF6274 family protein n=1 Tax=Streptomyces sp. OUCMDZ-4982 TaxID=2973090 RepID=UPI00215D40EF|nr:DUF6274 family protein [Streptomyces sp. OUCMDZ-4982]MCR8946968.1 DUF6274 family protein [Streptomyces sp. OUCMDZ-4982]